MVSVLGADCKHSCLTVAGNGQHRAQVCHLQLVQSYPTISGHADSGGELLYLWGSLILVIWGWWGGGGERKYATLHRHHQQSVGKREWGWGSKSQPWEVLNLSSTFSTSFSKLRKGDTLPLSIMLQLVHTLGAKELFPLDTAVQHEIHYHTTASSYPGYTGIVPSGHCSPA